VAGIVSVIECRVQQHAERTGIQLFASWWDMNRKKPARKPEVANYGKRGSGMILKEGLVIAIEPMITWRKSSGA